MCSTMRLIFNLYSTFNALFNIQLRIQHSTIHFIFNSLFTHSIIYSTIATIYSAFNFNSTLNYSFNSLSPRYFWSVTDHYFDHYFGGARSKGFATLRNVSKLTFFDKIGHAKAVGFRYYLAIWRSESQISSRYIEITSISLIYSLTFLRKKIIILTFRGLNRLTCVTRQIIEDSKLSD